jgi:hypothetical protein
VSAAWRFLNPLYWMRRRRVLAMRRFLSCFDRQWRREREVANRRRA